MSSIEALTLVYGLEAGLLPAIEASTELDLRNRAAAEVTDGRIRRCGDRSRR